MSDTRLSADKFGDSQLKAVIRPRRAMSGESTAFTQVLSIRVAAGVGAKRRDLAPFAMCLHLSPNG
jgi:hypothetical protein